MSEKENSMLVPTVSMAAYNCIVWILAWNKYEYENEKKSGCCSLWICESKELWECEKVAVVYLSKVCERLKERNSVKSDHAGAIELRWGVNQKRVGSERNKWISVSVTVMFLSAFNFIKKLYISLDLTFPCVDYLFITCLARFVCLFQLWDYSQVVA